jgi:YVTN family beta-propeller protein
VIKAAPSPDFIVLAGNYAFASGVGKGIGRFDLATGELVDSIAIPGDSCEALDAGFGAAWTATCNGPGLARIDATTGAVAATDLGGAIPDSEASIGVGEGAVWMVVDGSPRKLVRVDPGLMTVTAGYELPGSPTAVRAGLGAVWVSDPTKSLIHRVDPTTGSIVVTIAVGKQPQFIAIGEGALWTMNQNSGTVSRIDPATNSVSATIALGEIVQGGDIAVGGGSVWLRGSRTLLFQIDTATNEIVARYGPSAGSGSVAADDNAVWITAHDVTTIWRLEYSGVVE